MERGRRVKGWHTVVAVAAAWIAIPAASAFAHGGAYSGPTGPGSTGPGFGPRGGTTPTPGPVTPGTTPVTPGGGAASAPPAASSAFDESWESWWAFNRWTFLPDRDTLRRRLDATHTASSGVGDTGADARSDAGRARELTATEDVVPFLLEILGPERRVRDDVRASALIALGKSARGPGAVPVFARWLGDRRAADIVRESAALALGLLRRDDPREQMDAAVYDRVRGILLDALDDERNAPNRTRAFAAFSLGLLGDQPFGKAFGGDGRLMVRTIWSRASERSIDSERSIALLTALGLHPADAVSEEERESLHSIVMGKSVLGRKWDVPERSHALTAIARLGGPGCDALLLRMLSHRNTEVEVRCAALLGLAARSQAMAPEERALAIAATTHLTQHPRHPSATGLAYVTLGRLAGADLRSGADARPCALSAHAFLLAETGSASLPMRGYAALGLALSCRDTQATSRASTVLVVTAARALLEGLQRGEATTRSAYAVALGLLGRPQATDGLLAIVNDKNALPALRGRACVALGQIGRRTEPVLGAMRGVLADRRSRELRGEAAIGLSLLGDSSGMLQLVAEIRPRSTEHMVAEVAVALGRLDDLAAIPPLLEIARDQERTELTQALAVVSLGLLADPAPRSSLQRLTRDANYVARTAVLHEVLTIL